MSQRNQQRKRLRYYRRHEPSQDRMAEACGLEICEFAGECDHCERTRWDARTWVLMSRGETTEVSCYVCSDCLPGYYRDTMRELNWYGTRAFDRWQRHMDQQRAGAQFYGDW